MYDTSVVCTYNDDDVFTESDYINENEKDFIRDAIYRQELLNILCIDEYNEIEINKALDELYEKIKDCKELHDCALCVASRFLSDDAKLGLMILFSFDFMYVTHLCVSEYLDGLVITNDNMVRLQKMI